MKSQIRLLMAEESMVKELTSLSSEVFRQEAERWLAAGEKDANIQPPGYDSEDMMAYMVTHLDTYGIYEGDRLIGGAVLTIPASGYARIDRVFIHPGLQGKGYGKAAIERVVEDIKQSKEDRHTTLTLSYEPENTFARDLYTKIGFKEVAGFMVDGEQVARYSF
ncbi:GNAT family N-acetyltransferase [Jeotgalibacillus malaysiensis]|uniref:GNAT family N-acetyltransferase n=1 Tax=Jeotgalibacillus malaysiensis TaxID=1508404 RepID=UPI00384EACAE